ncbi:MAG TPA: orotate phosphoribosyltransferase [Holophagaceae bacterium]|jgi:orotate phosphoribosyltransferase|nr:orotate phosphoribosyltransferase [Holophagaceae bacterium]
MTLAAEELAGGLLEKGAVKLSPESPFTWSSGLKAPIYCDNRQLLGDPALRGRIADALAAETAHFKPSLVAGTSTAGIPWGALVADRLNLPFAYVRPEPKKHGMGRQVEGPSTKGQSVVLIEDLISTGGSSLKCVEALKAEGAEVSAVLALFSYGLPAALDAFKAADTQLITLATFEALVVEACRRKLVDDAGAESLKVWQRDAAGWSKANSGA